jgi:crotonobetainyl-CoA:carnitine CoA-transferase CaiB-like acyl-CoA transferase
MAVVARQSTGKGQCIDATLYESAFSLIEPHVPAYAALGIVAQRAGSKLPDSTPNNLYPTRDGRHIHITAMADSVFARLAAAIGRPELATDERFRTAVARSANEDALDAMIEAWTRAHDLTQVEQALEQAVVPASRIFDIADIFADPHFKARDMLVEKIDPEIGPVTVAGVVPKLSGTPGQIRHLGGRTGESTQAVLREVLGLSADEIRGLQDKGVIDCTEAAACQEPEKGVA